MAAPGKVQEFPLGDQFARWNAAPLGDAKGEAKTLCKEQVDEKLRRYYFVRMSDGSVLNLQISDLMLEKTGFRLRTCS